MMKRTALALVLIPLVRSVAAQTPPASGSDDPLDFALTLYRRTAAINPGANALVSPFSAREAVGLAYIGARGATADGLAEALRAGGRGEFAESARKTRAALRGADPAVTVEIANSLWLRSDWRFLDSYEERARRGFDAEVFRRDFSPQTSAEADAWVSQKTEGRITRIVDRLDPAADVGVLLNAVYFKGVWRQAFDRSRTKARNFHLASGAVVQRPRMQFGDDRFSGDGEKFAYAEDADLQAVRLPYGSGRVAMIVILPAKTSGLAALTGRLNGNWWRALRARMTPRSGDVELPRFKFDTSTSLVGPLSAMGAQRAFDRRHADFRDMAEAVRPEDMLYISQVRQKAMIEVDEDGTVAAAAASAVMSIRGSMTSGPTPFSFIVDRPFLFAIEDSRTGTLLFVGSVQDPG
jgi:serpin B